MEIKQVKFMPIAPKLKRVCAYARVSTEKDSMLHSIGAQADYYSAYIRHHPGWEYVGVYSDYAVTGTTDSRECFQNMLDDARSGKIDLIITKSVSRFARNTVTLLEAVRELKNIGVEVYFEEQNIYSMSADGELMLTVLASFAQEESRSVSENMKWRVRHNFEEGIPWGSYMLGYKFCDGRLVIIPEEAEIVKHIFSLYLSGLGYMKIAKTLNEEGLTTKNHRTWNANKVKIVLNNYAYTGNLMLQRTYRQDHISKKKIRNSGELPMYHAENTHDAIIDIETFNAVQSLKRSKSNPNIDTTNHYPFTGKIKCGICGKNYQRKKTSTGVKWICDTYLNKGKRFCPSKAIPEDVLVTIVGELGNVDSITAFNNNRLEINIDGSIIERFWKDRSRADSWTPEMKEKARLREQERQKDYASKSNYDTCNKKFCNGHSKEQQEETQSGSLCESIYRYR